MPALYSLALHFVLSLVLPGAGLTDAEVQSALGGEVPLRTERFQAPNGKSAGRGMGAIAIDRPVAEVWQTLIHFEHRAEYAPRVKSAVIVEQQADFIRVKMEIDASVTTARYTMRFQLDEPAHVITFHLDDTAKDNTIAAAEGEYRLYEVAPGRTLLVYRSYVDTGRAVPGFIQDYMAKKSVPNLLRAIKKRVESGGTWKK